MLLDWLIVGIVCWCSARLLNATAFKYNGATRFAAIAWAASFFIFALIAQSFMKAMRYRAMSESLGFEVIPRDPVDVVGALVFATVFYSMLRKAAPIMALPTDSPPSTDGATFNTSTGGSLMQQQDASTGVIARLPLPTTNEQADESLWAAAFAEFDSDQRRAGVWAKAYAEANGDERVAKALYLKARFAQMCLARDASQKEVIATNAITAKAEPPDLRGADRTPMGVCPNCENSIPMQSLECPRCKAVFGPGSSWQVRSAGARVA